MLKLYLFNVPFIFSYLSNNRSQVVITLKYHHSKITIDLYNSENIYFKIDNIMSTEGKSLIFFRSIIVILFISMFYLAPIAAQNSNSGTESHLVGTCQVFTKLQNEKLNIEKKLNETKQNFLPNLILEKSLTLKLDDLNSKLAFLTDNRYCSDLEKHIEEQN